MAGKKTSNLLDCKEEIAVFVIIIHEIASLDEPLVSLSFYETMLRTL